MIRVDVVVAVEYTWVEDVTVFVKVDVEAVDVTVELEKVAQGQLPDL